MKFIRHLLSVSSFIQLPKAKRRITFYSEGKAYWPHLEGILQEFLALSSIPVCYISSSLDDPGLNFQHPHLQHFIIDEGWIRNWFFANIETEIMVMTMPDLDQYQVKRSKFPVHYVYLPHSLVSCHMVYRFRAFDQYDTIFCAGPHHIKELTAMEKRYQLQPKNLVPYGYGRLDAILAKRSQSPPTDKNRMPHVLIAPSWGKHGIIETLGMPILTHLLEHSFQVTLRPHPQTIKLAKSQIAAIQKKFGNHPLFTLETNVASQESLHRSDIMLSDWSGAALDYAFGLEKPVIFIDVPKKINNPHYPDIEIIPFEEEIRSQVGEIIAVNELDTLAEKISALLSNPAIKFNFSALREKNVFHVGRSAQQGAQALIELINHASSRNK